MPAELTRPDLRTDAPFVVGRPQPGPPAPDNKPVPYDDRGLTGVVDDVRLYNHALTVAQLRNGTSIVVASCEFMPAHSVRRQRV